MSLRPGFIDEGGGQESEAPPTTPPDTTAAGAPPSEGNRPMLLDQSDAAPIDRIDHQWAPEVVPQLAPQSHSTSWLAAGVLLMLAAWVFFSIVAFVYDQYSRSAALGTLTVIAFAIAAG